MAIRDPWEMPPAVDDDDIDPLSGLIGRVARIRAAILEQRETDRILFCGHHHIDPATFTGCHGCRGTGFHWQNGLPCWCEQGTRQRMYQDRQEAERTAELAQLVRQGRAA